jgi:hypothetical protein
MFRQLDLSVHDVSLRSQWYLRFGSYYGLFHSLLTHDLRNTPQAHLYSTYIILNIVLSSLLGMLIDKDFAQNGNITHSLKHVAG